MLLWQRRRRGRFRLLTPRLASAPFRTMFFDGDTNNVVLLKGLSEAKYLALIPDPETFILRRDLKWCPTFRYLKMLLLNDYWCVPDDFSALSCILQHCPVLEELTFQLFSKLAENFKEMKLSCYLLETSIPALEQLKLVEVKYKVVDERLINVLEFLTILDIYFEGCEYER